MADMRDGEDGFSWEALVATLTDHPLRIATFEALRWIDHPLSIFELIRVLDWWPSYFELRSQTRQLREDELIAIVAFRVVRETKFPEFRLAEADPDD